jgi:hypothetical protein
MLDQQQPARQVGPLPRVWHGFKRRTGRENLGMNIALALVRRGVVEFAQVFDGEFEHRREP